MAFYVWSGAGGSGDGSSWANAVPRLEDVFALIAAGDTVFVAHDHNETDSSAHSFNAPGTEALPNLIYCVNRSGSVPPVAADLRTTAQVSTTGAAAITFRNSVSVCYGIIFSAGSSTSAASLEISNSGSRSWRLVSCSLILAGSSAANRIDLGGATSTTTILEDCILQFASTSQGITGQGRVTMRNCTLAGSVFPTTLFIPGTTIFGRIEGCDFSLLGSGKSIYTPTAGGELILADCKLGASVTAVSTRGTATGATELIMLNCDSGDTTYRTERWNWMGSQTTETTIKRTGGASDGTTGIAWKIDTTANSEIEQPYESLPIEFWNATTGSAITVTIEGIWGGGAVPTNANIWIDVFYLGTSGFPLATKATCGRADGLAAATNLAAGSGTWGGSTTKFKMSVTVTPQERGPVTIYVMAALVSSTFYIDPLPVVT